MNPQEKNVRIAFIALCNVLSDEYSPIEDITFYARALILALSEYWQEYDSLPIAGVSAITHKKKSDGILTEVDF